MTETSPVVTGSTLEYAVPGSVGVAMPNTELKVGTRKSAGPRLNIKTVLSTYGDFHVKDKTAVRTSYL